MGILQKLEKLGKLEKLRITAFEDVKRKKKIREPCKFEAMFNPTSFTQSYGIIWQKNQGFNSSGAQVNYARSKPAMLELALLLDGTGVHQLGLIGGKSKTVTQRVKEFLDVTYRYNGKIHEPNYLLAEWGALIFACRLQKVDITYNAFNRDGKPIRAELKIKLIADKEARRLAKKEKKESPDLTHSRVVRQGDTLPLLTRAIYGSSAHYVGVARFNDLDDFRNLTPGSQIHFPPLVGLPGGA